MEQVIAREELAHSLEQHLENCVDIVRFNEVLNENAVPGFYKVFKIGATWYVQLWALVTNMEQLKWVYYVRGLQ